MDYGPIDNSALNNNGSGVSVTVINRLLQNLFSILFPFYPFWAWLSFKYLHKPIDFLIEIVLIPIALYLVIYVNKKLPKYLIFFIIFTVYHTGIAFINNTIPRGTNTIYFLLTDPNILACLYFIIAEYTNFTEKFIRRMNKNILLIVVISLIVSIIQTKNYYFFFNQSFDDDINFSAENRIPSIYSWSSLNTVGITFPILVSILISEYKNKKWTLPLVLLSGIVVSFLTKGRYIMISTITAFSQLLFNRQTSIIKRFSFVVIFLVSIFVIGIAANKFGYDIDEVINSRILEKNSDMASAKARVLSYEVFLVVFPDHPVWGVGPETRKDVIALLGGEAPAIHVGYLCYLYFYGIVGCLMLFGAIYFLMKDAWTVGRKTNFWGSFYGLLGFVFANFTMVYFVFSEMGIVLALIYMKYYTGINKANSQEGQYNHSNRISYPNYPAVAGYRR